MTEPEKKNAVLHLGGHEIEVVTVDGLQAAEGLNGDWNEVLLRIRVERNLSAGRRQEITIHECVHAVSTFHGLNLDESQVRTLGLGLHQMLQPHLKPIA